MKWLLMNIIVVKLMLLLSVPLWAYNEEYKCKFLRQGKGAPRPDSVRLFYNPLEVSRIDWSRLYYNESFAAKNIYLHNDTFISSTLLEYGKEPIRAVKVSANDPLAMNFMRFIILLDSVKAKSIISGVWILTSKEGFFAEEVVIAKENLNCKRLN